MGGGLLALGVGVPDLVATLQRVGIVVAHVGVQREAAVGEVGHGPLGPVEELIAARGACVIGEGVGGALVLELGQADDAPQVALAEDHVLAVAEGPVAAARKVDLAREAVLRRRAGDDVHHAGVGAGAVQHRAGAAYDLDLLDHAQREGVPVGAVQAAGDGIPHGAAIQQHQHVVVVGRGLLAAEHHRVLGEDVRRQDLHPHHPVQHLAQVLRGEAFDLHARDHADDAGRGIERFRGLGGHRDLGAQELHELPFQVIGGLGEGRQAQGEQARERGDGSGAAHATSLPWVGH